MLFEERRDQLTPVEQICTLQSIGLRRDQMTTLADALRLDGDQKQAKIDLATKLGQVADMYESKLNRKAENEAHRDH